MAHVKKIPFLIIGGIICMHILSSCTFLFIDVITEYYGKGNNKYETIHIDRPTFTLAWDTDDPSVFTYRLFYKIVDGKDLIQMDQVIVNDSNSLRVVIDSRQFVKNTPIVLGVAAVNSEGQMSEIHFSTDNSAIPKGGWVFLVE